MTRNKNPLNEYSVIQTAVIVADTSVTSAAIAGTTSVTGVAVTGTTSISGSILYVDATTLNGGNFTGVGTITGSACKIMGTSGSINFADCFSATSGSVETAVWLKVNVTGSNYVVQLYAAP